MIDIELIKFLGSICAIGWVMFRVSVHIVKGFANYIRKEQRNEFQAGFFDLQEDRYKWIIQKLVELERRIND